MNTSTDVTTGPTSKKRSLAFVLLVCCMLRVFPCEADTLPDRSLLGDAKLYVTAPLHWQSADWMKLAGTIFVVGVAHEFDISARHVFEPTGGQPLNGRDPHSTRDAIPAAALLAGTWAFGALTHGKNGRHEAWNMAEAAGFSAVDTLLLKSISGRQRPNETASPDNWFQGGDSFPSMHVSAAFAIGSVFAESGGERHRWLRRTVGYGIAGATAFARLHDNVHWFSDVVAGAAIGMSTAQFVMRRDDETTRHSGFSVVPMQGGAMLTYWRVP
jgi:membrane-associated phospholipid phosphatase